MSSAEVSCAIMSMRGNVTRGNVGEPISLQVVLVRQKPIEIEVAEKWFPSGNLIRRIRIYVGHSESF